MRGLSKLPFLAADSSEAALSLSHVERSAVLVAKPFNLPSEDAVAADTARVTKAVTDAKGQLWWYHVGFVLKSFLCLAIIFVKQCL